MSDDLVKRLRDLGDRAAFEPHMHHEAADEITRLRAACDASEERERAIELRFWQTVDRDGLTGLPSDMWAALEQLTQDRAELATARQDALAEIKQDTDELIEQGRQDGMEQAAQIADRCAADWSKSARGKFIETKWDYESRADAGEEIAAAIRAAAKKEKP